MNVTFTARHNHFPPTFISCSSIPLLKTRAHLLDKDFAPFISSPASAPPFHFTPSTSHTHILLASFLSSFLFTLQNSPRTLNLFGKDIVYRPTALQCKPFPHPSIMPWNAKEPFSVYSLCPHSRLSSLRK